MDNQWGSIGEKGFPWRYGLRTIFRKAEEDGEILFWVMSLPVSFRGFFEVDTQKLFILPGKFDFVPAKLRQIPSGFRYQDPSNLKKGEMTGQIVLGIVR